MTMASHKRILASTGDAAGRIRGINHLQMVVHDMAVALPFYRDLLGFTVVRTRGKITQDGVLVPGDRLPVTKNYFFDLGNGELLTLIEVKGMPRPDPSLYADALWPGDEPPADQPRKVDHFSFNVEDQATLEWFREHLSGHGVEVSEIAHARFETASASPFVSSFCFYDPSGNPLEIATFDWSNAKWAHHRPENWLMDEEPVPALLDPDAQ
jgi:catechol 2,3-dioxygenase-like lactoylglutathione lyase family enzyme